MFASPELFLSSSPQCSSSHLYSESHLFIFVFLIFDSFSIMSPTKFFPPSSPPNTDCPLYCFLVIIQVLFISFTLSIHPPFHLHLHPPSSSSPFPFHPPFHLQLHPLFQIHPFHLLHVIHPSSLASSPLGPFSLTSFMSFAKSLQHQAPRLLGLFSSSLCHFFLFISSLCIHFPFLTYDFFILLHLLYVSLHRPRFIFLSSSLY